LKVALRQDTRGLWHEAHDDPKWLAGALWHDEHALDDGCEAAHETPRFLWHVAHETERVWPDGALWHEPHELDVWRNEPCANGVPILWHEAQPTLRLCPPGAAWHDAHELLFGWVNAQLDPAFLWQVTHAPGLCPAGAA